ncbi:MAG: YqjD family protein [Limisphaerales bacterium]
MKKNTTPEAVNELSTPAQNLVDDARELMSVTANVAEEKVVEARRRLAAALDRCKEAGLEAWENLQDKAVAGARATDATIRKYPYQSIGIAFGVGALIGFLLRRRD